MKINGHNVKPSHEVRPGEIIHAQVGALSRTVRVLGLIEQRVGAAAVPAYAEDLTPPDEYAKKREPIHPQVFFRPKGAGRPTKKDRRDLEKYL